MSITTTYEYSSGTGFSYDAAKIGFINDKAQLILTNDTGLTYSPDISQADYDPEIFEVNAGVLRQKDTRPANFQNYFAWNSQLDGNYGVGTLTVTATNGAAIGDGMLDLTGGTSKYVSLSGTTALGNIGTLAFVYKPNYAGIPGTAKYMYSSGNQLNNNVNTFAIYHNTDGFLWLLSRNSLGATIFSSQVGSAWSPISGTSYIFTVQLDTTNGATKLFIDGVQYGSTLTQTGVRTDSNWARVGMDRTNTANSNFYISSLVFYNAIVSPTDITPLEDYIYNAGTVTFPPFAYEGAVGAVQSWTSMAVVDANMPRYILNGRYWNGSTWVASNGSYAQATPAASVQTNISALPVQDTMTILGVYTNSNVLQASTTSFLLTYVGQIYSQTNPTIAPTSYVSMDAMTSFAAVTESTGSDGVKFFLSLSGTNYWHNGAAWVASNGSYSQANLASEINANVGSLPISLGAFVIPFAVLHSANGDSSPMLETLTMVSSYFGPAPTPPSVCTIFGYIVDEKENPISGATVSVTNPTTFINGDVVVAQGVRTTTTNSLGYFDIDLIETETMDSPALLRFDVTYTQAQVGTGFRPTTFSFGSAVIPNVPSANISTLTFG